MSPLIDGISIVAWAFKRVDQISKWIKGRVRSGKVKDIDKSVDSHDSAHVNDIVQDISKKRHDRTNAS